MPDTTAPNPPTVRPAVATPTGPATPWAPDGWTRSGRLAAGSVLLGLGLLWFTAEVLDFGKPHGAAGLRWIAEHTLRAGLSLSSDMLAVPLIFSAAVVWLLLARAVAPRLAWTGAVLLTVGAAGQGLLVGVETAGYMVARDGRVDGGVWTSLTDAASGLPLAVFFGMFFGGAFLGILVSMLAVWRSRTLPRGAIGLVLASQVAELADVPGTTTGIALLGLAWMAVVLLRREPRLVPVQRAG